MDDAARNIQRKWDWYQKVGRFQKKKGKKGKKGKKKKWETSFCQAVLFPCTYKMQVQLSSPSIVCVEKLNCLFY